MTAAFGSFGKSPFGAFVKSPLGARGGSAFGLMFTLVASGGNTYLYGTVDRVNWTQYRNFGAAFVDYLVGIVGTRVFLSSGYMDPPYTAAPTNYSGTNTLICQPLITSVGLIAIGDLGSGNQPAKSTDNGATWTLIANPASSTPGYSSSIIVSTQNVLRLGSGRLVAMARATNAGTTRSYPIYSDDDGSTWNGGPVVSITTISGLSGNFIDGSGRYCALLPRAGAPRSLQFDPYTLVLNTSFTSDVTGLDLTMVGAILQTTDILAGGNYVAWGTGRESGGAGNQNLIYSTDAFDNITTLNDYGKIVQDSDGKLWTFKTTDDKLYSSVDGVAWTQFAATVLDVRGRLICNGMLR